MLAIIRQVLTNNGVPEPVGRRGDTDSTGSDRQREDFTDNHPGSRAPGSGEAGNVYAYKCNHGLDCDRVMRRLSALRDTNSRDNKLGDDHTHTTEQEQLTTAELLDHDEGERSRQDVNESSDQRNKERVFDRTELLEKRWTKVEDEVDTSALLHHLETGSQESSADRAVTPAKRSPEDCEPGADI